MRTHAPAARMDVAVFHLTKSSAKALRKTDDQPKYPRMEFICAAAPLAPHL